jgi:hypothetical protein
VADWISDQRKKAYEVLLEQYRLAPGPAFNPLPILISEALKEDHNGSINLPPELGDRPSQRNWEVWNQVLGQSPVLVLEALSLVMGREDAAVPEDPAELPEWAAYLVVETLDELDLALV